MGLLAQHAYGKSKKISVGLENKFLNGVILSPKAEKPEKLKEHSCNSLKAPIE